MDRNPPNPMDAEQLLRELDHLQMAVTELQREVEAQASLATVGLLAASIAHEVCNRMTPVAACAQMALREPEDAALTRRALEMSASSAMGIADFARIVLSLAKPNPGTGRECAEPWLAWERVQALVRQKARDTQVRFETEIEKGLLVAMPQAALDHVLLNLAMNAIGAMPEGGILRVVGRGVDEGVEIRLADTGCGMDAATVRRALEPGFSLGRGSGLGLSLCDRLVRAEGGRLSIASEAGAGTTVAVVLPAAKRAG